MDSDSVSSSFYLGVTMSLLCCLVLITVDLCVVSRGIFNVYETRAYTGASIRTSIEELSQYDSYAPTCYRILSDNESLIKVINIHYDDNTHLSSDIDDLKKMAHRKFSVTSTRDTNGFYYIDMIEVK